MKTFLAAALCATALTSAAPALAQAYDRPAPGGVQPGHGFREQLDALDARVRQGIVSGQVDRGEADRATRELASIRSEMERMRAATGGQLSDMDRGRLQERLDALARSIRWMREHGPATGPNLPPPMASSMPAPMPGAEWSLERRADWLQQRISQGRADGSINRREAMRVQRALMEVRRDQARMMRRGHGHLRNSDRAMLEQRLDRVRDTIRWARQNDDNMPPWRR